MIPGTFGEVLSGKLEMFGRTHKVTIHGSSMTGGLEITQGSNFEIYLDEETDLSEPRQVLAVRIAKHQELVYGGGGYLNFFLILTPTGSNESELRRVGLAICDYGETKHIDVNRIRSRHQTALDASMSAERSLFTLV